MKANLLFAIAAALLLAGCGQSKSTTPAQGTNSTAGTTNVSPNYTSGNPLTAPADYLGVVVQAQKYSEKQIDLAYVNEAIQQFNAGEGRLPKSLQEMVDEHYLGKIPVAPIGYNIVYDATNGTIKVVKQ